MNLIELALLILVVLLLCMQGAVFLRRGTGDMTLQLGQLRADLERHLNHTSERTERELRSQVQETAQGTRLPEHQVLQPALLDLLRDHQRLVMVPEPASEEVRRRKQRRWQSRHAQHERPRCGALRADPERVCHRLGDVHRADLGGRRRRPR